MDDFDPQDAWDDAEEFEKDALLADREVDDREETARQRQFEEDALASWGEHERQRKLQEGA